jgi:hypothetical protein
VQCSCLADWLWLANGQPTPCYWHQGLAALAAQYNNPQQFCTYPWEHHPSTPRSKASWLVGVDDSVRWYRYGQTGSVWVGFAGHIPHGWVNCRNGLVPSNVWFPVVGHTVFAKWIMLPPPSTLWQYVVNAWGSHFGLSNNSGWALWGLHWGGLWLHPSCDCVTSPPLHVIVSVVSSWLQFPRGALPSSMKHLIKYYRCITSFACLLCCQATPPFLPGIQLLNFHKYEVVGIDAHVAVVPLSYAYPTPQLPAVSCVASGVVSSFHAANVKRM